MGTVSMKRWSVPQLIVTNSDLWPSHLWFNLFSTNFFSSENFPPLLFSVFLFFKTSSPGTIYEWLDDEISRPADHYNFFFESILPQTPKVSRHWRLCWCIRGCRWKRGTLSNIHVSITLIHSFVHLWIHSGGRVVKSSASTMLDHGFNSPVDHT